MAFLQPVRLEAASYVLRGLQPSEDRVALATWHKHLRRLEGVMQSMGELVAWGQLRSSGRDGSAIIDELIEFASQTRWRKEILDAAAHSAQQVHQDWKTFAAAYDAGQFQPD